MSLQYLKMNKGIVNKSIELGKKTLYFEAERKHLAMVINKDSKFQSHAKSVI